MSKEVVNTDQLRLFMTGKEWKATVTHSTDGPMAEVWEEKEAQARAPRSATNIHGAGLYDSIKEKGFVPSQFDSPPTIIFEDSPNGKEVRRVQSEGHHRVAAAAAVEEDTGKPVYMPTNYVDITAGARRRRRMMGQ